MKQIGLAVALLCVTTLAVIGHQAANVVNSSRSNIKNNLTVVSQDPDGKVHCKVSNVACTKDQIDQLNKVLLAGQVQGPGSGLWTFQLFQDIGDVFATVRLEA